MSKLLKPQDTIDNVKAKIPTDHLTFSFNGSLISELVRSSHFLLESLAPQSPNQSLDTIDNVKAKIQVVSLSIRPISTSLAPQSPNQSSDTIDNVKAKVQVVSLSIRPISTSLAPQSLNQSSDTIDNVCKGNLMGALSVDSNSQRSLPAEPASPVTTPGLAILNEPHRCSGPTSRPTTPSHSTSKGNPKSH
jgi:hypothetical protein